MASTLSLSAANCRVNMNDYSEKDEYRYLNFQSNRAAYSPLATPKMGHLRQETWQ
jgi:hypothetical protein